MKKNFKHLLIAMTVIAAAACTKEFEAPVASDLKLIDKTFSASLETNKSYIVDGSKVIWEEGDKIAIFDNLSAEAHEFTISDIDSTAASFSGQVTEGSTSYVAVYPFSAAQSWSAGKVSATLPAVQTLSGNSCAQGALVAVGEVSEGAIAFQNVFGRIKVDVTYNDITEIIINGSNLAGTASFVPADGTIDAVSEGTSSVTLLPAGDSTFVAGTYYIALLPGTTPAGEFSVTMKRPVEIEEGELAYSATQTATAAVTINQKGGINFSNIDAKTTWTIRIANKAELIAWNNAYKQWKSNDVVYLDDDIVLDNNVESEPWTAHDFPGTFEGQNHAIKKIHVDVNGNANFFNTVSGTVRNLTFGAATDDDSYFYTTSTGASARYAGPLRNVTGSIANITNYSTVAAKDTAGYYIGGVCCNLGGTATASNCTNYGSVSYDSMSHTHCDLGGIFAQIASTGSVKNCVNYGDITFKGSKNKGSINMGGIVGYCSKATPIDSCTNNGSVTITSATTGGGEAHIGGIIGYNQNAGATLTACCNKGKIENAAKTFSGKRSYLGGIIGAVSAANSNIFGCSNEGDITGSTIATYIYSGGIVGYSISSDLTIGSETQPCTNSGDITNSKKSSNGSENTQSNISLGGIVGLSIDGPSGGSISYCTNSGKVYNTGGLTYTKNYITLGGIIGCQKPKATNPIRHCTNTADVIDEAATTSSILARIWIGGISGYSCNVKTIIEDCVNNGSTVKFNTKYGSISNIGGIAGSVTGDGSEITRCTNNAKLEFYGRGSDIYGGLLGATTNSAFLTDCTNNGDIILNSYASGSIRVGGVVGNLYNGAKTQKAKVTRCTNTGNITGSSTTIKETRIGGIGASNTNYAVVTTDCCNTGNISYDLKGTTANAALILGGIFAYSGSSTYTDTNSTSNCTIAHTYETAPTKYQAGLLYGYVPKSVITNCGVAGSLDGVTADADNFETLMIQVKGSGTTTTGCYLITPTE